MSRELKFRAWSKSSDKFIHITRILLSKNVPYGFGDQHIYDVTDLIIEQYTGLKDKNGKEIYEGDIVTRDGYLFKVVWRKLDTSFILENDEDEILASLFMDDCDKYRVIGNIHENSELLKEK